MTPLGAVARGIVAGAVGTLAMDTYWYVRYRAGGGRESFVPWELSSPVHSWDDAPAPAQVGRRLYEAFAQRELPGSRARLVNTVTHWGYGLLAGAQYGLFAGSLQRPRVVYGLPFGAAVFGAGYVVLPVAKLYKPIWEYDAKTLATDLGAHLVYGLTTASAFRR